MLISIQFIQILKQITLKNNDRDKRFRGDTSGLALPHIRVFDRNSFK